MDWQERGTVLDSNFPAANQPSYVMCLWQPKLAEYLLSRARVHFILFDVEHVPPDPALLARAASFRVVSNFNALEELAVIAADLRLVDPAIEKVLSFAELSQLGAATVSAMLGLSVDPVGQVAARDKRLMKQLVREADVRTADFWSIRDPADAAAVRLVARRVAFPAVVKPAAGSGTEYTARVADAAELSAFTERFASVPGLESRQLIVEEFVQGTEMHIDAFWDGDQPTFFLVSEYLTPILDTVSGDVIRGSRVLVRDEHVALYDGLLAMNRAVNDALGISAERSVTHMEAFRTPSGEVVFSEIATRIGGAWIPALLSQALGGQDIWAAMADALMDGKAPEISPTAPCLAGLNIRAREAGVITSLPSDEQLLGTPGILDYEVRCEVGDELMMDNASEMCVFVVIGADSPEQLDAYIKTATQRIRVETRPFAESD
ncbi:ATP-grasp domain-containing protein [Streptomyces sp. NPDC028722]|uniref:ATP-grasp domain-containing protein n=1 Tax=Streptomyces sp. NPDC028722 TaxID=3155016 RepID=UPI0033F1EA03